MDEEIEEEWPWIDGQGIRADKNILTRMVNMQWAPNFGENYENIDDITVLHNGVFIVRESIGLGSYFVSSKNLRLLRDRFYLASLHKRNKDKKERWSVREGKLYLYWNGRDDGISHLKYFGIRKDKLTTPPPPPEHCAKIIQAFWMAFRGELHSSHQETMSVLGRYIDYSTLTCHDETFANHIIAGGHFNGLKELLRCVPRCVNYDTLIFALLANREDMALLIASKITPNATFSSRFLWFTLTDHREELNQEDTFFHGSGPIIGFDLNLTCIREFKSWMEENERPHIPPYLRMFCSVCARTNILTMDGKQIAGIIEKYLLMLITSLEEDDENDEQGLDTMLKHKAHTIIRLFRDKN